jgi:hypothetical protein
MSFFRTWYGNNNTIPESRVNFVLANLKLNGMQAILNLNGKKLLNKYKFFK